MVVYLGIDWSEKKHDVVFLNEAGAILVHQTIPHQAEGFLQLEVLRQKLGVEPAECVVGLETAHNVLIDFLWSRGYSQVYVVPPSVVKSSRGRYGTSGARSDRQDGRLVGDLVRTDRARLQPWRPDSLRTRQMRAQVSLISHLTRSSVRLSNRLRAVLLRYYPAAVEVFSDLTTQISLHFVRTYPTPQAAAALTWEELLAFARQHRYPQPEKHLPKCYARLQAPQPQASLDTVVVYQAEAGLLAGLLLAVVQAKQRRLRELTELFEQHPDQALFASLPGTGAWLAPALLVHFGDDRERFPTPASVQCLAGTCPVTEQSGKHRLVRFRRACDRQFRTVAQQWARHSLREGESLWARAYWEAIRPHCRSDSHAYRCLANRWLAVAWKLWQKRQPYDETYHLKQRTARSQPRR